MRLFHIAISWLPVTSTFSTARPSEPLPPGKTRFHTLANISISDTMPEWIMSPGNTTASTPCESNHLRAFSRCTA